MGAHSSSLTAPSSQLRSSDVLKTAGNNQFRANGASTSIALDNNPLLMTKSPQNNLDQKNIYSFGGTPKVPKLKNRIQLIDTEDPEQVRQRITKEKNYQY